MTRVGWGVGNEVDPAAQIADGVIVGSYNRIGPGVVIQGFRGHGASVRIGDCNDIHANTRILAGPGGITIGDWNVLHNTMLVMANAGLTIGHNCWFGQHTILDGAGGLVIGHGVRVGMYSQLWTHVASGELIEGCTLFAHRPTEVEDDVWLVGSCIVGSGLRLGRRSICLISSNITKDTEPGRVYGGSPARLLEKLSFWKPLTLDEKMTMLAGWLEQFAAAQGDVRVTQDAGHLVLEVPDGRAVFGPGAAGDRTDTTYFDVEGKTYTKRLSSLERRVYRFLFDHKARFLPTAAGS
jgi:acetyltransferase-like isoleucine patch superfamily enzyme